MKFRKTTAFLLAAAMALPCTACSGEKFTVNVRNLTGVEISEITMYPENGEINQENRLDENLANGSETALSLGRLTEEEIAGGFEVMVYNAEDNSYGDFGMLMLSSGDTVTFYIDNFGLALGVNMTDEEIEEQKARDNAEYESGLEEAATEETTEAATEPTTEETPAETEPEATAETEAAAENDSTTPFYRMIVTELVPQYGLSDLDGFDEDGAADNTFLVKAIPEKTQGVISAQIQDFDANESLECIVLRAEADQYILDHYNADCTLVDSYVVHSFIPDKTHIATDLHISVVDSKIVIHKYQITMPGYSTYGTETVILQLSEQDGFTELLNFGGRRSPLGGVSLHVNETGLTGDESMEGEELAPIEDALHKELEAIGMTPDVIHLGWDMPKDLSYGIAVDFAEEEQMIFEDTCENDLTYFQDYTGLRNTIS